MNPRRRTILNSRDKLTVICRGQNSVHLPRRCLSYLQISPLVALQPFIQWLFLDHYFEVMNPEHARYHLRPVSAYFKNEWNSTSIYFHGVVLK
jgi:hypothetical protein